MQILFTIVLRELFKGVFVDVRPPHAQADGRAHVEGAVLLGDVAVLAHQAQEHLWGDGSEVEDATCVEYSWELNLVVQLLHMGGVEGCFGVRAD